MRESDLIKEGVNWHGSLHFRRERGGETGETWRDHLGNLHLLKSLHVPDLLSVVRLPYAKGLAANQARACLRDLFTTTAF